MSKNDSSSEDSHDSVRNDNKKVKTVYDAQRKHLAKLMSHPEREVEIPRARDEDKKPRAFQPHEYVRNVMGASAGAGSGEFDIYRGCRRRENIRQEYLTEMDEKQKATKEFEEKRLAHLTEAEKRTAKKRAKRLKQKEKMKNKKAKSNEDDGDNSHDEDEKQQANDEEEVIDLDEKEKEFEEKSPEVVSQ